MNAAALIAAGLRRKFLKPERLATQLACNVRVKAVGAVDFPLRFFSPRWRFCAASRCLASWIGRRFARALRSPVRGSSRVCQRGTLSSEGAIESQRHLETGPTFFFPLTTR